MQHVVNHLNIEVTRKCNQRCAYCFNDSGEPLNSELSLAEWLRILTKMRARGLKSILVTGGEPFVWPNTVELLREAQEIGLKTALLSNGFRIPKLVRQHAEIFRRLLVAQISLDAMDPDLHDARRGLNGAWWQAMDAIQALRALDVPIEVSCTVSDENLDELEGMGEFCHSIGAALLIRPMATMGRASAAQPSAVNQQCLQDVIDRMRGKDTVIVRDRFVYAPDMEGMENTRRKHDILTVEADGRLRAGSFQNCGVSSLTRVTDLLEVA